MDYKVSFVMPAFKAKYLKQAIHSIISQDYDNLELIIVDDCSPEDLKSVVDTFDDPRINYYRNTQNIGGRSLVEQWNHSIMYASGDFIALAADDEIYDSSFASECIKLAKKYPSVDLIRSRVSQIDENDVIIGHDVVMPELISKYGYLHYFMTGESFTCIGNFLFKTEVLKQKKFYDCPCGFCSDTITTVIMSYNGVANTEKELFSFRQSSIHLSGTHTHLKEQLEAITKEFSFLENLSFPDPDNELDRVYSKSFSAARLKEKKLYDYYNQVIKYLPVIKLHYVNKCQVNKADRIIIGIRYFYDQLFK